MTDFRLKRAVAVSSEGGQLRTIDAGTPLEEIPEGELAQLAPDHFVAAGADDGSGVTPDDWRTDEATLAHDRRQTKAVAAENKARLKAKRERDAAATKGKQ